MSGSSATAEADRTFSARSVAILLAVGVGGFIALAALAAYAPELRDGSDGGAHALSRSAVGFSGLAQLLKDTDAPVLISRGPLPEGQGAPGLMILTPPDNATAKDLARVKTHRPTLIVAPKWIATPAPLQPGWVQKAGLLPARAVGLVFRSRDVSDPGRRSGVSRPVLHGAGGPFSAGLDYPFGPVDALQTASKPGAKVLLADAMNRPVLLALDSQTYLLTDPDLLNNQGLRSLATAKTALAMLEALRGGQGPVVFDVTLNGFERSRSLLRIALAPPFLGATLCALAAALLMGAHAAARFGAPRRTERAFALGKRALADNAAALIHLARREPKMGARYAALTRRAVAQAVAAGGREAGPEAMDAALDRLATEGEAPLSALLAAAGQATDENELMLAVRRLHQRRLEMTRERL